MTYCYASYKDPCWIVHIVVSFEDREIISLLERDVKNGRYLAHSNYFVCRDPNELEKDDNRKTYKTVDLLIKCFDWVNETYDDLERGLMLYRHLGGIK